MSDFEIKRLYSNGLPKPRTQHSVQSIDKLLTEIQRVRENKYSTDFQEVAEGIVCFGASVLDSQNTPIAGVAVSVLVDDATEQNREKIIQNVLRIASTLSTRMGAEL